jgi:hypothetical protein
MREKNYKLTGCFLKLSNVFESAYICVLGNRHCFSNTSK